MKYEILHSYISRIDLIACVNDYLAEGWELQGGVSFTLTRDSEGWAQAMILRDAHGKEGVE